MKSGYPSGLTVSAVGLLLRVFHSPDPSMYSDFTSKEFDQLIDAGLIRNDSIMTERGECFARAIMEMPLPVQKWEMP